jgi:Tol biopolymer transport system component
MPDGRGLLYVSNAGGARDVYFQAVDRSGSPRGPAARLTTGISAHGISLSRDGTRLAYSVLSYRSNIFAAPIAAGRVTPSSAITALTDENQTVEGVGVTTDGKWLVFDSNRGGNSDIYKMPIGGGEPIQLTKDPADDFIPQWSRDGRQIVFHSWRNGNRDVFTMDADGSNLSQVTSDSVHEMYPDWAPDGQRVVYQKSPTGLSTGLFTASRTASGAWQVATVRGDNRGAIVRWTHDGKYLVHVGPDGARLNDPMSGRSRVIATNAEMGAAMNSTAVGPDTTVVYLRAVDSTGVHSFFSVPVAGGRPRLLLRLDDPKRRPRRHEFATDSKRLYFTITDDDSDIWVMDLRKR